MILSGLGLSIIVAYLAFFLNWITLDATKASVVIGTIVIGFAGIWPAVALAFFFISSSFITRKKREDGIAAGHVPMRAEDPYHNSRRDGYQVWANGFWVAVFALLWFQFEQIYFLMALYGALATATADTWATELGSQKEGRTRMITNFKKVEPGTDGGVSWKGSVAAIFGSCALASLLLIQPDSYKLNFAIIVAVAGFLGSVTDSYLGAYFQTRNVLFLSKEWNGDRGAMWKNCFVNWLATGIGGLLTLLTIKILTL